jgi:hypothetical protein
LNTILKDYTDSDGKVNYKEASDHPDFAAFEEAACELQALDYESMSHKMKLAFSINLYNLFIRYAFVKVGVGSTSTGRIAFFNNVGFEVGRSASNTGRIFLSFQDLEHGILRGNRKAPYALWRQFSLIDERNILRILQLDNRIHFALNCGATSCPPVKTFTAEGVEEELRIVARAFCEDDNNVVVENDTLYINKILYWYMEDFGGTQFETAKAVLGFLGTSPKTKAVKELLDSGSLEVKYNDYDWSTDAIDALKFAGNVIKPDTSRLIC